MLLARVKLCLGRRLPLLWLSHYKTAKQGTNLVSRWPDNALRATVLMHVIDIKRRNNYSIVITYQWHQLHRIIVNLMTSMQYGLIIEVKERPPQTKLKWPMCPPCIILSRTTDRTFLSPEIVLSVDRGLSSGYGDRVIHLVYTKLEPGR